MRKMFVSLFFVVILSSAAFAERIYVMNDKDPGYNGGYHVMYFDTAHIKNEKDCYLVTMREDRYRPAFKEKNVEGFRWILEYQTLFHKHDYKYRYKTVHKLVDYYIAFTGAHKLEEPPCDITSEMNTDWIPANNSVQREMYKTVVKAAKKKFQ